MFDFSIILSFAPALGMGALLTLQLTALIIVLGICLAVPVALAKNSRWALARISAHAYIAFFRGTPSLVQVFLLYYGAGQFQLIKDSFVWVVLREPFWCVVIALGLNSASYTGKTLAAALAAVPKGVRDAAYSLGMSRSTAFLTIYLPMATRTALPAFGNEVILTCKATSLASTVTLMELTGSARLLSSQTYAPYEVFASAGIVYLVINYGLMLLMRRMETAFNYPH